MGPTPVPHAATLGEPPGHARTRQVHGITVVELHGSIDIAAVRQVTGHLQAATAPPGARVVADLRQVTFLDCSALEILCAARNQATQCGGHLGVVCARPWHLRILRAAGLHRILQPAATLQQALDHALRHPPEPASRDRTEGAPGQASGSAHRPPHRTPR